jgi:carbonic anhydrase
MVRFSPKNDGGQSNRASRDFDWASTGFVPGVSKRRNFLQMAVKGTFAGLAAPAGLELLSPGSVRAQSTLTPQMALNELVKGNKRFVSERLLSFQQNLAILRNHTSELQQPFAGLLSCADSRVPVELIFDQSIGQIFVTRAAGNVATPEIIGSLEYGAAVLGIKVIVVMGHGKCGAVEAAVKNQDAPGQISALYPHIQPAIDLVGPDFETTTKVNAKIQANLLRKASTVISRMVQEEKLIVIAAYYNIASGVVTLIPCDEN